MINPEHLVSLEPTSSKMRIGLVRSHLFATDRLHSIHQVCLINHKLGLTASKRRLFQNNETVS